ncbi:MAG: hypothetical protein ACRD9R_17370, partial [Pyrinomonadaceae bacterium]
LKASPPPEAAVAVVEPQISPTTTVKANRPEPPVKAPASSSPLFASAQRQAAGPHRRLVSITAGAVCLVLLSLSVVLAITQRTRFKGAAQPPEHSLSAPETFVGPTQPAAQPAEPPATTPDDESAAIASPEVRAASNKSPGRNREAAKETTDPSSATTSPQPESAAAAAPAKPAMTRPTERAEASKKTAALKKAETPKKKEAADGGGDGEAVRVLMQIENGRVVGASVVNSRPGMQAYEAMALRLARGRRYAATSGQETITIKINPSQPR